MEEETRLDVEVIPMNCVDSGRVMNGMFKTVNLIEGIIMAIPGWLILRGIHFNDFRIMVYAYLLAAGVPLLIGVIGINDEDFFSFIYSFIKFNKNKRVARYNARPKVENSADYIYDEKSAELPREKLERMFAFLRDMGDETDDLSDDITSPVYIDYFAEDVELAGTNGVPELPDELKSASQRRAEAKAAKKAQKEMERQEKADMEELKRLRKEQKKLKGGKT